MDPSGGKSRGGVHITGRAESTGVADQLELDPGYFATLPGVLKVLQLVFGAVSLGCASPAVTPYARFFLLVVASYFAITLIFCLVYFFGLKRVWPSLPWMLAECVLWGCGAAAHLAASSAQLWAANLKNYHSVLYAGSPGAAAYIAAGCFGLFNSVALAASCGLACCGD